MTTTATAAVVGPRAERYCGTCARTVVRRQCTRRPGRARVQKSITLCASWTGAPRDCTAGADSVAPPGCEVFRRPPARPPSGTRTPAARRTHATAVNHRKVPAAIGTTDGRRVARGRGSCAAVEINRSGGVVTVVTAVGAIPETDKLIENDGERTRGPE